MKKLRSDSFSCPLFPACSGCKNLEGVRIPEVWKEISEFFLEIYPFDLELVSEEIIGWRSRAKLAVMGSFENPQIGLFEEGSHRVIDMKTCPLHYPVMNEALGEIRVGIKDHKVLPYQEKDHLGRLKYIQMVAARKTGKIQLTLVFNSKMLESNEQTFVKQLYKTGRFHSIWINYLPEKTNTILGKSWELIEGEEDFFQEIKGISFAFHPSCFAQAHLNLFEEMISYIDSLLDPESSILELYAGVGCIGLSLAHKVKKLTLVESSPYAKQCFEKSVANLDLEIQKKCHFFSKKVEDLDSVLAEVVLVDPPRKGLSKDCKEMIFKSDAKQLIYISCGYESFMRDCKEILEKGWKVNHAKGFLLFPATNHVEIVASFEKIKK